MSVCVGVGGLITQPQAECITTRGVEIPPGELHTRGQHGVYLYPPPCVYTSGDLDFVLSYRENVYGTRYHGLSCDIRVFSQPLTQFPASTLRI